MIHSKILFYEFCWGEEVIYLIVHVAHFFTSGFIPVISCINSWAGLLTAQVSLQDFCACPVLKHILQLTLTTLLFFKPLLKYNEKVIHIMLLADWKQVDFYLFCLNVL